jgi:hypothetical protein
VGDVDENLDVWFHAHPGVDLTLKIGDHWGAGDIEQTWTLTLTRSQWNDIRDSAPTSQSAFDTACASAFATWYAGRSSGYKSALRATVRQIAGT